MRFPGPGECCVRFTPTARSPHEAQALHGRLALPRIPPFPPDLLAAIELEQATIVSIRNILAAYDRTNAMALVALSALLCRLEGQPADKRADS